MPPRENQDIFDKFGETARKVLINAQVVASSMQNDLGAQHILISLASIRGTLSFDILREHLIAPDQIRLILGASTTSTKKSADSISDSGKTILKRAVLTAANFHHISVDCEHLLMACVSSPDLISYQIISQLGSDPEKIKQQLVNLFNDLTEMDDIIRRKLGSGQTVEAGAMEHEDTIPQAAPETSTKKKKSKTPALDYFTIDLTKMAASGELDAVVGREKEINRALQILARRTKNNPVFVGDPGVGKTALVEGIAQLIANGDAPAQLKNKKILALDLPLLVAGTIYRGQFEERIKKLIDEIIKQDNIVLFIDEIHTIVGAGSAEGSIDAANILKPALTRNKIRLIGATTNDEYRKYIEKDSALERRLQQIRVTQPSPEETVKILNGLKPSYEKYHNVVITDEAIRYAVEYSTRYISDRFLPDKAIDVLDEAAASESINATTQEVEDSTPKYKKQLEDIKHKKSIAVAQEKYDVALKLRTKEKKLQQLIKQAKQSQKLPLALATIDKQAIAKTIAQTTGVPIADLMEDERIRLAELEKKLSHNIIAQPQAIAEVSSAIRRNRMGLGDEERPVGSFIFLGPTGVGKTELAKVLAREIYGSTAALIKIDMSEFMERHNVSRLVGAPPGYVGYEEAGKLTEAVRRQPYSVVLFDEIEKAHPEFFNILLQVLDEGVLTDSQGRRVNFKNTIIIMTSNIGLREYHNATDIGFSRTQKYSDFNKIKDRLLKSLDSQLRPEFINRLDKIVVFQPLDKTALKKIVSLELNKLKKRILKNDGITLTYSQEVVKWLVDTGTDIKFGARPIKRAIQNYVENAIAQTLLKKQGGKRLSLKISSGKIVSAWSLSPRRNK